MTKKEADAMLLATLLTIALYSLTEATTTEFAESVLFKTAHSALRGQLEKIRVSRAIHGLGIADSAGSVESGIVDFRIRPYPQ